MTKQSPRIYVYKITFLEVPHYYYGAHLEKVFNEYYMGSPETHKNFWKLYTPQKELIKEFPYTDEGWLEALDFEDSLIEPVYNIDPLCLNEHCGGKVSLDVCRKTGRRNYELGLGIHAQTKKERIENGKRGYENGLANFSKEERSENSKKGGQKTYELGIGLHALTKEEKSECAKMGGQKAAKLGVGVHSLSKEERIENGKRGYENGLANFSKEERIEIGKRGYENGLANFSKEERIENGKKSGQRCYELGVGIHALTKEERIENGKKTSSQVWECTVTGYRSTPGGLSSYQKKRNIDTKNRIRIK